MSSASRQNIIVVAGGILVTAVLLIVVPILAQPVPGPSRESDGGVGDTSGPASSTDDAVCRFDGTTGKILQNSGVTLSDTDDMVFPATGSLSVPGSGAGSQTFGPSANSSTFLGCTLMGDSAVCTGNFGTAVGENADSGTGGGTCVGRSCDATGGAGTSMGLNSKATASSSSCFGQGCTAAATGSSCLGQSCNIGVSGLDSLCAGKACDASASGCVIIGANSSCTTGSNSTTLGNNNDSTTFSNVILVGHDITATANLQGEWGSPAAPTTLNVHGDATFNAGLTFTETGADDQLTIAAIADGQTLIRSGTSIIGSTTGVFGQDYQTAVAAARTTTTSTTFQTKVGLTTPSLTGLYRVGWSAYVDTSVADEAEFRLQNTTDVATVTGIYSWEVVNVDQNAEGNPSNFAEVTFTGAAKTFEIQFRNVESGTTGIKEARIEIWKVGN